MIGQNWSAVLYPAVLEFLIRYRRTVVGPAWLLIGPALFIALLGELYAHIGSASASKFIPYLTIGLVTWTFISGMVTASATVFQRARSQILQGGMSLSRIAAVEVITYVLTFLNQFVIVIAVMIIYGVPVSLYALVSIIGLAIVILNGVWVMRTVGVLGARYRDVSEIFQAIMRIAFLATPIMWMPGEGDQSAVMGKFLLLNPFYHFIELVRAPLLGYPISLVTWIITLSISIAGLLIASALTSRYNRFVALWV